MKPYSPGPLEAVPDTTFEDVPTSGWAIFPADDRDKPAIAVLLGPLADVNAEFLASAPRWFASLCSIAETPLEGEDCDGEPQHWFGDYRERFEEIVQEARAAIQGLRPPSSPLAKQQSAKGARPQTTADHWTVAHGPEINDAVTFRHYANHSEVESDAIILPMRDVIARLQNGAHNSLDDGK